MKVLFLLIVFGFTAFSMPPAQSFNLVHNLISQLRLNDAEHKKVSEALTTLKGLVTVQVKADKEASEAEFVKRYMAKSGELEAKKLKKLGEK